MSNSFPETICLHHPESVGSDHVSMRFFQSSSLGLQAGSSLQSLKKVSRMTGHSMAGNPAHAGTSGGEEQALSRERHKNSKAALLFLSSFPNRILIPRFISPPGFPDSVLVLFRII